MRTSTTKVSPKSCVISVTISQAPALHKASDQSTEGMCLLLDENRKRYQREINYIKKW
jgi:hypothetical protein